MISKAPNHTKQIQVSIFCSGAVYPSDSADVARGQSRTGGLVIQVFTDGSSHDKSQFLQELLGAAQSCFGIRVPIGGTDGITDLIAAIFPLVNPSRNRCELFSCFGALRVLESFMKSKRNEEEAFYDIKVFTDSSYAWKFVRSTGKLLELGSYFTAQEMLSHLDMPSYSTNIDILHPLARSFCRLNGRADVLEGFTVPMHSV